MTKKNKTTGYLGIAFVILSAIALGIACGSGDSGPSENEAIKKDEMPGKGESLQSGDFEVTLVNWYAANQVNTGNMFANLKPEQGQKYLVIRTTYKNTGTESETIWGSGKVIIDVDGKRLTYDNSETVLVDGWGNLVDTINPMVTKTTNLVFKIPADIKGDVYWTAGRSWSEHTFYLGSL